MTYDYFVIRTRANGTRTVYGVTGEVPPVKEGGGYLLATVLDDTAFPEDTGNQTRIYKPAVEGKMEAPRGVSYDLAKTLPTT